MKREAVEYGQDGDWEEVVDVKLSKIKQLESELFVLKAEMEKEEKMREPESPKDKDELKDELLKFKKWYDSLSPASKCTVHPPAGSGGSYGIYNLTDAGLINNYLSKTQ